MPPVLLTLAPKREEILRLSHPQPPNSNRSGQPLGGRPRTKVIASRPASRAVELSLAFESEKVWKGENIKWILTSSIKLIYSIMFINFDFYFWFILILSLCSRIWSWKNCIPVEGQTQRAWQAQVPRQIILNFETSRWEGLLFRESGLNWNGMCSWLALHMFANRLVLAWLWMDLSDCTWKFRHGQSSRSWPSCQHKKMCLWHACT